MHRSLLVHYSEFFRAALEGRFKENEEATVRLPEQKTGTFKFFLHWLYVQDLRGFFYPQEKKPTIEELHIAAVKERNRHVPSSHANRSTVNQDTWHHANFCDLPLYELIELYIFATRLIVKGLRDRITSALIEVYGYIDHKEGLMLGGRDDALHPFWTLDDLNRPSWLPVFTGGVKLAFDSLGEGDQLRRLLQLMWVDNASQPPKELPRKLVDKVFCTISARIRRRVNYSNLYTTWNEEGMMCNFHSHDVPCEHQPDDRHGCPFDDEPYLERSEVIPDEGLPRPYSEDDSDEQVDENTT